MVRPRDLMTMDLFAQIPQPAPDTAGAMSYSREIAHVMSAALKSSPHDRYEVAARMSRFLGREITLSMLNAYTAESHDSHNISLERAVAFDAATDGYALLSFFAAKRGCGLLKGKEALVHELGRIEQMCAELASQRRAIKDYLKGK